jgi:hypothetical protein
MATPQTTRILLAAIGALVLAGAPARAAVYYHVDAQGVYHFTNAPTKPWFRIHPAFGLPKDVNLTAGHYADLVHRIAHSGGVDPDLVKAIIRVESNFNPLAVSRKGAQGLMQLMPTTAANHAVANSFDPEQNIIGGVGYLRKLLDLYRGDLRLALAAYNAGENAVARYQGIPPYRETREYVRKVLWLYRSRTFDLPSRYATTPKPSPGSRQVVYIDDRNDGTGAVYRTRSREGLILYTNTPR